MANSEYIESNNDNSGAALLYRTSTASAAADVNAKTVWRNANVSSASTFRIGTGGLCRVACALGRAVLVGSSNWETQFSANQTSLLNKWMQSGEL